MLINNLLFFSSKSSKQKLCYFVKKVVLKYGLHLIHLVK